MKLWNPFKKRESSQQPKEICCLKFVVTESGLIKLDTSCISGQEAVLGNLIYQITSGRLLGSILEIIKASSGDNKEVYEKVAKTLYTLFESDAREIENEEEFDEDEPVVSPSNVFGMSNNEESI